MNDFIKAILGKAEGYKAVMDIGNGKVGITPEYTADTLNLVIAEAEEKGHKLIKIIKA